MADPEDGARPPGDILWDLTHAELTKELKHAQALTGLLLVQLEHGCEADPAFGSAMQSFRDCALKVWRAVYDYGQLAALLAESETDQEADDETTKGVSLADVPVMGSA